MTAFVEALMLQAGYNAALVAIGAALLGLSAGAAGSFLFLRKRALVSDAIAHATLPGIGLAFIVMVMLGGDGRSLVGLLAGSALSAAAGLWAVQAITRNTRLPEDTAIGAVLSVTFGFGIVLLTIIQSMTSGRQAGLESFLLGSTAGMLYADALIIAAGGALSVVLVLLLRRPMTLVAFDEGFAAASGVNVARTDMIMMVLGLAVTVTGLKIVGLILIIALLIIPPVTARFWTDRSDRLVWIAGGLGAAAGHIGAALSASAPSLPTGPIIVLISTMFFTASLSLAPQRGVLAALYARRRFQTRVHRRQGLLALARSEPIHENLTLRILQREGLIRADQTLTEAGHKATAQALRDERRWHAARLMHGHDANSHRYDGLTPIGEVMTPDEIAVIDARLEAIE
ncbi:metal ABC transporter permease [Halovulum sp. GXIMD14793]